MMTERRTIAILGEVDTFCPALAEKLAQQHLRLLFVSADEESNARITNRLRHLDPSAEIEFINCETEGCWEADIITLTDLQNIDPELVQRIKKVATRKVVLAVSGENEEEPKDGKLLELQELLPHSHVFQIGINRDRMKANITGSKDGAEEVQAIFRNAGYKINY